MTRKTRYQIYLELAEELPKLTLRELKHSLRMQRFVLFLFKKETLFLFFLPIFMGSFIYRCIVNGLTPETLITGMIEAILYFPFYHFLILGILFKDRYADYKEIKDRLELLRLYFETIANKGK